MSTQSQVDLELFFATFDKRYGKSARVDLLQQPVKGTPGTFIPTSSESLNLALGIGGLPLGRIVEIFGPESSGKSTLALDVVRQAQFMFPDKPVGYLDVEQAVNKEYAETIGIDLSKNKFVFAQEMQAEKVLNMTVDMATAGFSIVVLDSVASMIPESELEAEDATDRKFAGVSAFMSTACRKIVRAASATGCLVIALNQLRDKPGVMFGDPETTPGGRALKFYSTVRIRTAITGQVKVGETVVGATIKPKIVKCKVAPPYRTAQYNLLYGKGIDTLGDLLDVAADKGILDKSGAWYKWEGKNVAQGREKMRDFLVEKPEVVAALRDTLWSLQ